jgi:hypothetical protein
MNPLQNRLRGLRSRLRRVTLCRGGSLLILLVVGGAALAGLLDWQVHLPGLVRALLLVTLLASAGILAYRLLLAPLTQKTDDLALALRVEERYPVLNDALASTIQFLGQPSESRTGSPVLRREAVVRAMRLAQGCDFNQVVHTRWLRTCALAAILLITLAAGLFLYRPTGAWAWTALARLGDPFGEHDWPRQTQIALNFPDRVATGQPFVIHATISGVVPEQATIELEGMIAQREVFRIVAEDGKIGRLTAPLDMSRQDRDFRFRVRVNDAVDPPREGAWHQVTVSQPPRLVALNGLPSPQIHLAYPAYTDKAPQALSPGVGRIEAVAGTVATIRGATDRPISRVWVEHRPDPAASIAGLAGEGETERPLPQNLMAASLGPVGLRHPVEALALTAGGHAVWGRTYGTLAPDARSFTVTLLPWMSGGYVLHLEDAEGLAKDYEYDLQGLHPQGLADPVPVVNLERPSSSQSVLANADVVVQATADDEFFAVRSMYLEYRRKDKEGKWLDAAAGRVPLYDGPALGEALPQILSSLASGPLMLPAPPLHLRPRQVLVLRRWSLAGLVKEGDILVLQVCAHDFNDVAAFNVPGRSHEVELRVVGRPALEAIVDEAQGQVQQELIRLREWQEQALKKVIEAEQEWRATGKLRPETLDKLLEAEQVQKQIQARVGAKEDEGLRAELERLKQMMSDNKLPPSGAQDRVKMLKSELDRLAREKLPQAEQHLADASKDHKDVKDAKPPAAREKGNLGKARADQQEVQQTLDELLKALDAWATRNEIKAEARAIQQEQRELQDETAKLAEAFPKLSAKADEQFKAALRKTAELQRRLGERAQRLLDKMDRVGQDRLEEVAKQLEAAAKTELAKKEVRDLLKERRDLKEQADRLENEPSKQGTEAAKAKNATAQRQLALRLKDKIDQLPSAAQDRAQKDLTTTDMLEKAAAIGKNERLPGAIKDVGEQLVPSDSSRNDPQTAPKQPQDPQFHRAQSQQKDAIGFLDQMVNALEERREEEVDRLTKKQRGAEKDLAALQDKQERLQKKVHEALANPNAQEREQALQKLAQEQRELEEEVARKARELARLQAHQAGKALGKAGQQMEKAAGQLDRGEDPDEAQEEALDNLDEAREKLQQAEQDIEDELAREQLTKIADQLKALKERQDGAIDESVRIHQALLQRNKWTKPLKASLSELARVQEELARETKSVKEKLKGAPAFELVLDRASRAMEDAALRIQERKNLEAFGGLEPFAPEELAAENKADAETRRRQREASRRLENLLDALKPEEAHAKRPKEKKEGDKQGEDNQGQKKGGIQAGDSIPPVAQLKLLRAEQQEVNERTREFAEQHPNPAGLTPAERQELQSITEDQERVFELFRKLMAAGGGEGEAP